MNADITTLIVDLVKNYPWFGIVTAVISLASAIVAVTPTPKEGSVWGKAYKVLEVLALVVGKAKNK